MGQVDLGSFAPSSEVLSSVPPDLVKKHRIIPVSKDDQTLTVAIGDPMAFDTLAALQASVRMEVIGVVAEPDAIEKKIQEFYPDT